MKANNEIMALLGRFQAGYVERDLSKLDEFMSLFAPDQMAEMIGIGVFERFQGQEQIREMIESDWKYWGDVIFELDTVRIKIHGEVAWVTMRGALVQTTTHETAMPFYLQQMKDLLDDETVDIDSRIVEASHFGIRRWRERTLGMGHRWPFLFTTILVNHSAGWKFHLVQWAMPVD